MGQWCGGINFNNNYSGGGFNQYLSSGTLMHSSLGYSFSKEGRFKGNYNSSTQRDGAILVTDIIGTDYLELPTTKSPRTTTFGFGKKY